MSSTALIMVDGVSTDISITRYASATGPAYQITWRSSDKEHLFDYVNFDDWETAKKFALILNERKK